MKKPITTDNAFLQLATLCARSEQAEGDLRKKLQSWGINNGDADSIISRLKQERYLDNERYARAYCRDKLRFNGWGRLKISFMLRGKGIEQEFIDQALAEIDDQQYANVLEDIITNKAKTLNGKDSEHKRAALLRFATSRGFETNLIFSAIARIMSSHTHED